eukprot:7501236-Pyramimonas_sp.AAC.1
MAHQLAGAEGEARCRCEARSYTPPEHTLGLTRNGGEKTIVMWTKDHEFVCENALGKLAPPPGGSS